MSTKIEFTENTIRSQSDPASAIVLWDLPPIGRKIRTFEIVYSHPTAATGYIKVNDPGDEDIMGETGVMLNASVSEEGLRSIVLTSFYSSTEKGWIITGGVNTWATILNTTSIGSPDKTIEL